MKPIIDHIQITVRDLDEAVLFYDQFMPLIGFDLDRKSATEIPEHEFRVVEYSHPDLCFALTSPRSAFADEEVHRRKPGAMHHIAFRAPSRDAVDQIYDELKSMGAVIVAEPKEYPEYVPKGYYALFFKDNQGMKLEIVHTPATL